MDAASYFYNNSHEQLQLAPLDQDSIAPRMEIEDQKHAAPQVSQSQVLECTVASRRQSRLRQSAAHGLLNKLVGPSEDKISAAEKEAGESVTRKAICCSYPHRPVLIKSSIKSWLADPKTASHALFNY